MKLVTSILTLTLLFTSITSIAQTQISETERDVAIIHLKSSKKELLKTIKGLSEVQLNYKTSQDSWSISECVEHIAIVERNLFGVAQGTLQNDPNASKRSNVTMTDEQIIAMISSRENKIKTRQETEPTNSFGNYNNSLKELKDRRKTTLKFIKVTKEDLRNRYFKFPFGTVDTYQLLLFISSHCVRHTSQIKEIMLSSSFPR